MLIICKVIAKNNYCVVSEALICCDCYQLCKRVGVYYNWVPSRSVLSFDVIVYLFTSLTGAISQFRVFWQRHFNIYIVHSVCLPPFPCCSFFNVVSLSLSRKGKLVLSMLCDRWIFCVPYWYSLEIFKTVNLNVLLN